MIDALQCFLAVVDAGNLSAAARSLQLAVSSVSRKIDVLEADLGAKLFHRSSRVVLLTDAGEQFVAHARAILAELAEGRNAIGMLDSEPRGLLTVTAPAAFSRRHLGPAVASFLRRYPDIELDLSASDEIVDLQTRRVDVAVRVGILPDSDLLATQLAPQHRYVCASPDYVARHGRPQTPADLLHHNCIMLAGRPKPHAWWAFKGVNRGQALDVRGSFRTDDVDLMVEAALAGVGIIHMAGWVVDEAISSGALVVLFGPETHPPATARAAIHAVRLPGRSHPVKAQLFIQHVRDFIGAPPYWERKIAQARSYVG
ncbi:MAG: LysR substrate-binding domain-containing protein [Gammaproteobacteria bacterium]